MNVIFVLSEPRHPENIGAAARAIKTMGFNRLRLVNPLLFPHPAASRLAWASNDILDTAEVFTSLEEAVADADFIIGTSSKKRNQIHHYYKCSELKELLASKNNSVNNIAIVFGGEESGLSNVDLLKCSIVSFIPLKTSYPSLNLAQAVMIYAYELSALLKKQPLITGRKTNVPEQKHFLMAVSDFINNSGVEEGTPLFRRMMLRASALNFKDMQMLTRFLLLIKKNGK
jgi:tRNA/rRNA methyltransferase